MRATLLGWWVPLLFVSVSIRRLAPPPVHAQVDDLRQREIDCLVAMLGSNTDTNLFLNYAEFLNWMVATSDGCLTVTDVMGLELYGALFQQIACTCNDYPTPASPQLQLPCISCDDSDAAAAVIALPGVYPANDYPGAYTVDACRSLLAVIDDLCVDGALRLEPTRSPVVVLDATTAPVAVSTSTEAPVTFPPPTTVPTTIATATQTPTAAPTEAPVVVPAPPVTAVPTAITTTETPTAAPILSIVDTTPSTSSPITDSPLVAASSPPPSVTKPTNPSTTVVDTPTIASGTGDDAATPPSDRNIDSEANAVEDDNEDNDDNNNRTLKIVLSCLLVWAFLMIFALYVLRVRKESQARRAQFWRRDGSFPTTADTIPSDKQQKNQHYRYLTERDGDASSMENGSAPPRQLRESSIVTFERQQRQQEQQQQPSVESSLSTQTYNEASTCSVDDGGLGGARRR